MEARWLFLISSRVHTPLGSRSSYLEDIGVVLNAAAEPPCCSGRRFASPLSRTDVGRHGD
jgi:hypothetical protein